MSTIDLLKLIGFIAAAVALVIVVRLRRRSHATFLQEYADQEVCEHLRPALAILKSRGHVVVKAGQRNPDLPLEIYLAPRFDPNEIAREAKLDKPAGVSERRVIYCEEDWCELHPAD